MLKSIDLSDGDRLLEIGVGTGRNLIVLAKRHPTVSCYGLDASKEMLSFALKNVAKLGLTQQIQLAEGQAEDFSAEHLFETAVGTNGIFDAIIFSYSFSMMSAWKEALHQALELLKPEKKLYIVDFWDQRRYPVMFRHLLSWWLSLFHVRYEPGLLEELAQLEQQGAGTLEIQSVLGGYAFIAVFKKR